MSNGTASTVATALQTALSTLTPGQLLHLSQNITQADEVKAMQILSLMSANPPGAGSLLSALEAIKNLPPAVITYVGAAIANPSQFSQNMTQAMVALQSAKVSFSLGGLFG